jgi:pantoate--beta-alanine ligase
MRPSPDEANVRFRHNGRGMSGAACRDREMYGNNPGVRVIRSVPELRQLVGAARRDGKRIGFVPTMGFLHEGHLSLIRRAASDCDVVVLSIFVNPTQFTDAADLEAYPRDEARDVALACGAGAHVAFIPGVEEVYPDGFAATVRIDGPLTETLEGESRGPSHFWGVATVVAKLFAMVQPDLAYFGQKDAQQCVVVRRLVADLNLPVQVVVCPTVREADGLAMSSRNVHLQGADREQALALVDGLRAAAGAIRDGETDTDQIVAVATKVILSRGLTPEYVAVVDPDTLAAVMSVDRAVLVVVAARVGPVRLIDNMMAEPTAV